MESLLIIIKSGVEAESRVVEGLRLSAAMLGMDQTPKVAFLDDGVKCLRPGMLTDRKSRDYLQAVADLGDIYVLSKSLKMRGMRVDDVDPSLKALSLNLDALAEIMAECRSVVTF